MHITQPFRTLSTSLWLGHCGFTFSLRIPVKTRTHMVLEDNTNGILTSYNVVWTSSIRAKMFPCGNQHVSIMDAVYMYTHFLVNYAGTSTHPDGEESPSESAGLTCSISRPYAGELTTNTAASHQMGPPLHSRGLTFLVVWDSWPWLRKPRSIL